MSHYRCICRSSWCFGWLCTYLPEGKDNLNKVYDIVKAIEGVENVWTAENVAKELEQPLDREGDLAVVADKKITVIEEVKDHDLMH